MKRKLSLNCQTMSIQLYTHSKYMRVEGNEIVLSEHMLNSRNDLIYNNNGDPVIEKSNNITINYVLIG
jgi:hypothetical protein